MAEFTRNMGKKLIDSLSENELFKTKLKPDIQNGQVFFAIRPGYGSFYVKGRSLFTYKSKGFSSHEKFVFIPDKLKGSYIYENQLKNLQPIPNFCTGYERIKKRAEQYADDEAIGVSALYAFAPNEKNIDCRYFLVDIEVVFDAANDDENNDNRKTDRIDFLLYDNYKQKLLFCEAKHFSNPEIWASENNNPKVVMQLEKYNRQIFANKDVIIKQYTNAFSVYNALMGTSLKPPLDVHDKCGLYIFGFNMQGLSKLKSIMNGRNIFYGHPCRIIGNSRGDSVEKIYGELT